MSPCFGEQCQKEEVLTAQKKEGKKIVPVLRKRKRRLLLIAIKKYN